jgi:hypothetical protein
MGAVLTASRSANRVTSSSHAVPLHPPAAPDWLLAEGSGPDWAAIG